MPKNDGGPIHPCIRKEKIPPPKGLGHENCVTDVSYPGMTLRQWYAAHAPTEIPEWFISRCFEEDRDKGVFCLNVIEYERRQEFHKEQEEFFFRWRFYYADQMLAHEEKEDESIG